MSVIEIAGDRNSEVHVELSSPGEVWVTHSDFIVFTLGGVRVRHLSSTQRKWQSWSAWLLSPVTWIWPQRGSSSKSRIQRSFTNGDGTRLNTPPIPEVDLDLVDLLPPPPAHKFSGGGNDDREYVVDPETGKHMIVVSADRRPKQTAEELANEKKGLMKLAPSIPGSYQLHLVELGGLELFYVKASCFLLHSPSAKIVETFALGDNGPQIYVIEGVGSVVIFGHGSLNHSTISPTTIRRVWRLAADRLVAWVADVNVHPSATNSQILTFSGKGRLFYQIQASN